MSETTPLPPQPDQTKQQAAIVAAVAALLLISEDPSSLAARVAVLVAPLNLGRSAIIEAVRIALIRPVSLINKRAKNASGVTRETEAYYRASYLVSAARRISASVRLGHPLSQAVNAERTIYQRHLDAQAKRMKVARTIDRSMAKYGLVMGWYAKMDARTSAECRAANGKNFNVDVRPPIGFPGTVHPNCRCTAGPKHATATTVYGIKRLRAA